MTLEEILTLAKRCLTIIKDPSINSSGKNITNKRNKIWQKQSRRLRSLAKEKIVSMLRIIKKMRISQR